MPAIVIGARRMSRDSELYLILDAGGQSLRARVHDQHGQVKAESGQAIASDEQADGRVTLDGEALVEAAWQVLAQVADELGSRCSQVAMAGLAVQRGSVLCWDRKTGQALSPVFSWRDRRGFDLGDREREVLARRVRSESGLRFSPYGGAAKIRWSLDNLPEVQAALQDQRLAAGPLGSFLLQRLLDSSPLLVDDTLAQRTLLWSRRDCDWSNALLEAFGIPRRILPEVVPGTHEFGYLGKPFSGVPLRTLVGDQNALAWLGGAGREQCLMINVGTGAFMLRPTATPLLAEGFQTSFLERDQGGCYALEASIHGAASALEWLARREGEAFAPDRLAGLRRRCPDPPLFLNAVDGLGSPWWLPGIEPEFIGQADADGRLLAVLESIVFLARINLEHMESASAPVQRILVSGGLSRSPDFCQLLADGLGRGIERLDDGEGTAAGTWCRLSRADAALLNWTPFEPAESASLEQRFQSWRAHMPPEPEMAPARTLAR